jgi:spore coat protein U-like protein
MKTRLWRGPAALAGLLAAGGVHAAITCGVSSAGFASGYNPAAPAQDTTQTFFTVTCTRGAAGDPVSVSYNVYANNGVNASGNQNRGARGAARINYDLYRDAVCGSPWQGFTAIAGTINFSGTGTVSQQGNYWGCIPAGQGVAAGTYTDTVTLSMLYSGWTLASGTAAVSILTPATCTISSPPGNIVFNYTAFGAAVTPSTTFRVTCTNSLPYAMALDATTGTVVGLSYSLALSAASSVGNGAAQLHTINGNMAAGQAGTCATGTCTGTQARSITITY